MLTARGGGGQPSCALGKTPERASEGRAPASSATPPPPPTHTHTHTCSQAGGPGLVVDPSKIVWTPYNAEREYATQRA